MRTRTMTTASTMMTMMPHAGTVEVTTAATAATGAQLISCTARRLVTARYDQPASQLSASADDLKAPLHETCAKPTGGAQTWRALAAAARNAGAVEWKACESVFNRTTAPYQLSNASRAY